MSIKKIISTISAMLVCGTAVFAQEPAKGTSVPMKSTDTIAVAVAKGVDLAVKDTLHVVPEGYRLVDSVYLRPAPTLDSTLYGKNIFDVMPSKANGGTADIRIEQSALIRNSLNAHIESNPARSIEGYRVRIFFDNKQTSRVESEEIMKRFAVQHPDIKAYRIHVNPYFKVTVGDYRTKSEAMQLLRNIRHEFPTAFIVKEKISYPVVDRKNPTVSDTVKVLRPLKAGVSIGQ